MRRGLIILLFAGAVMWSQAQNAFFPDSLSQLFQKGTDDTNAVKRLINSISLLPYNYPDSGLKYANRILQISQQLDYPYGKAEGYFLRAGSFAYGGDYASAISNYTRALQMHESMHDRLEMRSIYQGMAYVYSELGDQKKALEYLRRARAILALSPDSVYQRIDGKSYANAGNLAFNAYQIAEVFLKMGNRDSALKYSDLSYAFYKNQWPSNPRLRGDIYFTLGDYSRALGWYNTITEVKLPLEDVHNLLGKANVYKATGKYDSARMYATQALDTAVKISYAKGTMQASELLSKLYEQTNPSQSLKYLRVSLSVRDSLYSATRINQVNNIGFNEELRRLDAIATEKAVKNRFKIWMLVIGIIGLSVAGLLLWRNNLHRKKANQLLEKEKRTVENTLAKLRSAQAQLIQSEKMASLGELTAGIAHEIQNPLNFVNNFSEVNSELIDEVNREIDNNNKVEAKAILHDLKENQQKINTHGRRADAIVKNMLEHSRVGKGDTQPTSINDLCERYLRFAYQNFREKEKSFDCEMVTNFDESIGKINIVPQDIGRVLLNLFNNAFYACTERSRSARKERQETEGMTGHPQVLVETKKLNDKVEIRIVDNGNGIPSSVLDKIFQPFFTTKPHRAGNRVGIEFSL